MSIVWQRYRVLVIILSVLAAFFVFGRLSLPYLGAALVSQDEPQHCDTIVVLMGSGPDRMLWAADLYKQGYADEVVMVRNMERGYDLVVARGVKVPHDSEIARDVAVQLGVPGERVKILQGDALSTRDEAVAVRGYLNSEKGIDSLMIVTSKYHSSRAKIIFTKAMKSADRSIRIISCPTPYDDFNADVWWRNREDLKRGVMEYAKLIHFYLREQFYL